MNALASFSLIAPAAFKKRQLAEKDVRSHGDLFQPSVNSAMSKVQSLCADGGFEIGIAELRVYSPHFFTRSIILLANALTTFGYIFAATFLSRRYRLLYSSRNITLNHRVSLSGFPFAKSIILRANALINFSV